MKQIPHFLEQLWRDQTGQDLVEYAMIAGFMSTAAAAAVPAITGPLGRIFSGVASRVVSLAG